MDYDKFRTRVGMIFAQLPFGPNFWTALAILSAIVGFFSMIQNSVLSAFSLFLLSGIFDIVGGGVARVKQGETAFGAWLDDIADKLRETLLYLSLFFVIMPSIWISKEFAISLLIILSFAVDYIKTHGYYRKVLEESEIEIAPGSFERVERFAIVLVGLIFYQINTIYLIYLIYLALLLSVFRILQAFSYIIVRKKRKEKIRKIREVVR